MKKGRKSKGSQYSFRRKNFSFHQYWLMYFTECYSDKTQKDFGTFIKAKSYSLAKIILKQKSIEDNPSVKLKAICGYMMHKDYRNNRSNEKLSMSDWENIRNSCFPNLNNFLFKKEIPRPEGYTNKYNQTSYDHIKKIGFKKGANNWSTQNRKGKHKSLSERKGLKWNGGDWVEWDKEEMRQTKNKIIDALIVSKNNRSKAADYLKISRSTFHKLMFRCEEKSWWHEHYPIVKVDPPRVSSAERSATQKRVMKKRREDGLPFFHKTKESEEKRVLGLQKAKDKQKLEYRSALIPKIKKALSENQNIRSLAAKSLNVKQGTFKAWLAKTKHWVDWKNEYPSSYNNSKTTWKTIKKS